MFRLRTGYFIGGIATGFVLLFNFIVTLPDAKLHIHFCDVGQGDAAYVRFPDGRDMLVDGGPNDRVLGCLGKHMPFWDRHIDMIVLTHPQKDHMQGLVSVLDRYSADYVVRSDIANVSEGYDAFERVVARKKIPVKLVTAGQTISVGSTTLWVLWPSKEQVASFKRPPLALGQAQGELQGVTLSNSVLGAASPPNLNDGAVVFWLRYGSFDALFPGDADSHVEENYQNEAALRLFSDHPSELSGQALEVLEVLKVPHHGSRTGMSEKFIQTLHPALAVISVGKNTYGHPDKTILQQLALAGSRVLRTDQDKDIEVVSDGNHWTVSERK